VEGLWLDHPQSRIFKLWARNDPQAPGGKGYSFLLVDWSQPGKNRFVLSVDPAHRGRGHGSRLLSAALQTATSAGEQEAVAWIASGDDLLRRFLESAGWAADGAHRTLADDGDGPIASELRQVRLGTLLVPPVS